MIEKGQQRKKRGNEKKKWNTVMKKWNARESLVKPGKNPLSLLREEGSLLKACGNIILNILILYYACNQILRCFGIQKCGGFWQFTLVSISSQVAVQEEVWRGEISNWGVFRISF